MIKNITILGSTGSIGKQTLDIIRNNPDKFKVVGLSARKNVELLARQIEEFKPFFASVFSEVEADSLKGLIGNSKTTIYSGIDGLNKIATVKEAHIAVIALVGISGLLPTIEAIKAKKTIALANKEVLVAGGSLVIPEAKKNNVQILPVDSEHSAIFQCIANNKKSSINKIIITASGGPFRTWDESSINEASVDQALAHPNWAMGKKVTIDSSTMMNKALEIIEAKWLFNLDYKNIEVIVHPQSIVHSMVEFIDGSVIAQLSNPTMHLPIQYALSYPDRIETKLVEPLNLGKISKLEFYPPDTTKFPCLNLAYSVGEKGNTYPTVLNAANEIAVDAFIKGKIKHCDIYKIVKECIDQHQSIENPDLNDILSTDKKARDLAINTIDSSKITST